MTIKKITKVFLFTFVVVFANTCMQKGLVRTKHEATIPKTKVELPLQKKEISNVVKKQELISSEKKVMAPLVSNEIAAKQATQEDNTIKAVKDTAIAQKADRTVVISNNITQDMTTYKKHWTGNYTPSKFIVMVNDQELKQGEPLAIKLTDDVLKMSFNYEFKVFGKVHRSGGKEIKVKLPKDAEKIISTFSWDNPHNLILDKGEVLASQEIA